MSVLNILTSTGSIPVICVMICFIVWTLFKFLTVVRLTSKKSKDLSDESIKSITEMMSKGTKIRFKK